MQLSGWAAAVDGLWSVACGASRRGDDIQVDRAEEPLWLRSEVVRARTASTIIPKQRMNATGVAGADSWAPSPPLPGPFHDLDDADRTLSTGQMIDAYLTQKAELDDRAIHLLFSANRWERACVQVPT